MFVFSKESRIKKAFKNSIALITSSHLVVSGTVNEVVPYVNVQSPSKMYAVKVGNIKHDESGNNWSA